MNKEEILSRSRKELKNSDLVEMQTSYQAGNIAGRVGGNNVYSDFCYCENINRWIYSKPLDYLFFDSWDKLVG